MNKKIDYSYFHWGPYLYKTIITQEELDQIKKLCIKDPAKDSRTTLAGLIKNEYKIDHKALFPILLPYFNSYAKSYPDYSGKKFASQVELVEAWVNYMTKFESNPIHTHGYDWSFVIYTHIPTELKTEWNNTISSGPKPGAINFIISLNNNEKLVNEHTFMPQVGDFFIFPSCLNHYVNSFTAEGERISVSGNLIKK